MLLTYTHRFWEIFRKLTVELTDSRRLRLWITLFIAAANSNFASPPKRTLVSREVYLLSFGLGLHSDPGLKHPYRSLRADAAHSMNAVGPTFWRSNSLKVRPKEDRKWFIFACLQESADRVR